MARTRVLIAGAAGRDFHNFNLVYRGREEYEVVAFTATQIPNIDGRVYPAELAGSLLRELWALGNKPTAEELLKDVSGAELELASVEDRIRETLS